MGNEDQKKGNEFLPIREVAKRKNRNIALDGLYIKPPKPIDVKAELPPPPANQSVNNDKKKK